MAAPFRQAPILNRPQHERFTSPGANSRVRLLALSTSILNDAPTCAVPDSMIALPTKSVEMDNFSGYIFPPAERESNGNLLRFSSLPS